MQYAIERDVVVVASAGNAGTETPQYPGGLSGCARGGGERRPRRALLLVEPRALGEPDRPGLPDGRGRDDAARDDLRHLVHTRGCRGRRGPDALTEPGPHRRPRSSRRCARPPGRWWASPTGESIPSPRSAGWACRSARRPSPRSRPGDAACTDARCRRLRRASGSRGRRSSRRARSSGGSARRSGSDVGDSRCSCSHRSRAPAHSRSTRRAS